jgi:hypothetical protein
MGSVASCDSYIRGSKAQAGKLVRILEELAQATRMGDAMTVAVAAIDCSDGQPFFQEHFLKITFHEAIQD